MGRRREVECTLWLLVHTMTITEVDYQVRAQFVHAVLGGQGTATHRLLARRVRMSVRADGRGRKRIASALNAPSLRALMKRNTGAVKHQVRAMHVDSCSSSKFSPVPSQTNSQSGPVFFPSKQQLQQPIVQIVAPLQQVQASQEPIKHEMQPATTGHGITTVTSNEQVRAWLTQNRFQKFAEVFQNFNGHDLLRLSRNDILQICGEADGIRFFNVLHDKAVTPRSKIYVCHGNSKVFHAVFLTSSTQDALKHELCKIVGVNPGRVTEIYMEGPNNIHVIVCDSVVYHMKEESVFAVSTLREKDQYVLLMKLIK